MQNKRENRTIIQDNTFTLLIYSSNIAILLSSISTDRLTIYLTEPANRPLVGQFVFPGEIETPLLTGDEGLSSGIGGPGLHPGHRQPPGHSSRPPPALLHFLQPGHAQLHTTKTRLTLTCSPELNKRRE